MHTRREHSAARSGAILLAVALAAASAGCGTRQHPPAPPSPTAGAGVEGRPIGAPATTDARAMASALRFLRGYLAMSYGDGRAREIRAITPQLRDQLEHNGARVPPAQRTRHPRVADLRLTRVDPRTINARATILDGGVAPYPLFLTLTRTGTGWLVSSLGD